jgi:pimeloyl-ACP methyl ester carboxylesterase
MFHATPQKMLAGILLAVLSLPLLAACGSSAPAASPTEMIFAAELRGLEKIKCPSFTPQGVEITCGTLEVPENYEKPDGRKIDIFVTIVHSPNPSRASDPLVLLPFSPVFSIVDQLYYIVQAFGDLLQTRDVVFYDYRGLGAGGGPVLDCPELVPVFYANLQESGPNALESGMARAQEAWRTCRETLYNAEIDPTQYTARQMAADLDALRLTLGYSQYNLFGGGFGADVAVTMIQNYPQAVRSAILVNFVPPLQYTTLEASAISLQNSLDQMFSACGNDQDCRLAYPDLKNEFFAAADQLNAQPAAIKIFLPGDSSLTEIQFDGYNLIRLARDMLSSRDGMEELPLAISQVRHNEAVKLAIPIQQYWSLPPEVRIAMSISTQCSEIHTGYTGSGWALQGVQPVIQEALMWESSDVTSLCPDWNGAELPPPPAKGLAGDVPVLVMQGELDPYHTPEQVAETLAGMKNVVVVPFPNVSADIFGGLACPGVLAEQWLENPGRRLDTACTSETEPLDFKLPSP